MKESFTIKHYIGDAIICTLLAILLTVACFAFSGSGGENKKVRILKDGEVVAVYKLTDNLDFYIDGVNIKVCNGKAVIAESDCADKVCISMPGVDKKGGGSVCIPNRIVLEPVDTGGNTDAVAG